VDVLLVDDVVVELLVVDVVVDDVVVVLLVVVVGGLVVVLVVDVLVVEDVVVVLVEDVVVVVVVSSTWHVASQPSPPTVLLSSQSSRGSTMPLPQLHTGTRTSTGGLLWLLINGFTISCSSSTNIAMQAMFFVVATTRPEPLRRFGRPVIVRFSVSRAVPPVPTVTVAPTPTFKNSPFPVGGRSIWFASAPV
jgi:hypothetical protein